MNVVDEPSEIPAEYVPEPNEPDPETVIPPPELEIVVVPEKVFVPDRASVPALDLVKPYAPDRTPEMVAVTPDDTSIVESAPIATVPDHSPAALNDSAPAGENPVPEIVKFSETVIAVVTFSVDPLATVVAASVVPNAATFDTSMTPALTVVVPV